jgi:hypothetical protein
MNGGLLCGEVDTMVKCPFCQYANEDGALFCEQCKSDLGLVPAEAQPAAPAMPAQPAEVNLLEPHPGEGVPVAAVVEEHPPLAEPAPLEAVPAEENPFSFFTSPEPLTPGEPVVPAAVPVQPEKPPTAPPEPPRATLPAAPPAAPPAPVAAETSDAVAAAPAAPADSERLPAGAQPKLVVLRGLKINVEYPIYDGHNFIGRFGDKSVDIDLEDQEPPDRIWSSRQHAVITYEDGKLIIEDLNSSNGTFVNRNRIHPGQKRNLRVNDVIQIGTVQMKVKL